MTQEVEWGKGKWDQLHADCTWSLKGCKGEGCVWKRLPLDMTPSSSCRHTNAYLLEHNGLQNFKTMLELFEEKSAKYAEFCRDVTIFNRKCKRREAQMFDAFKLFARAQVDENFAAQITPDQMAEVSVAFERILKNIVPSDENGEVVLELLKKMKGHGPEVQKDPKESIAKVMDLVKTLLEGSPEEKLGLG